MSIAIENTPVTPLRADTSENDFHDFIRAMSQMDIGQSIVVKNPDTRFRVAMTTLSVATGKQFLSRKSKDGAGIRFGRVA